MVTELAADVAAVRTGDFDLLRADGATSTTAWTWWRSRCTRDSRQFTLVLHTHLPWLAHHGRRPVGEEWLYQSWSASHLPLMRTLRTLAAEGRRGLITLGVTPVVTAQLDDPYCLDAMDRWLANWQLRALEAANVHTATGAAPGTASAPEALRAFGIREHDEAERALEDFGTLWRHGASPLLRELIDAGTVELLERSRWRIRSSRCSTRGCVSSLFARAWPTPGSASPTPRPGSGRRSAPTRRAWSTTTPPRAWGTSWSTALLHGDTALGRPVGDTGVVAFGRDLQVSHRVWSPKSGYPGNPPTATSTPTTT